MADPASNTKECPDCGEPVRSSARKCRFCQHQFESGRTLRPTGWFGAIALLVIGAVATLVVPKIWEAVADPLTETRVLYMRPWNFGVLDPSVRIAETHPAHCIDGYISEDPEALRCFTDDESSVVIDPCWPSGGDLTKAVCLTDPWRKEGVLLDPIAVDGVVASGSAEQPAIDEPWAVELDNGEQCVLSGGATDLVAGMRLNYACDNGWVVGDVNRTEKVWRALYNKDGSPEISQVRIREVWV